MQRNQWDIMARILRVAQRPAHKTQIMFKANLSYSQLERYLKLLLDKEFLRGTGQATGRIKDLYLTTEIGRTFIKAYQNLKIVVEERELTTN